MNCAACDRHLSAYIDDELTNDTRLEIEAHLDECERCRGEFESHQAAWEAAQLARPGRAPEGLWDAVVDGLEQDAGGATSLDDLALMLRGLAGEVQDLRREMGALRRALETGETAPAEEREEDEDIQVRMQRFPAGLPASRQRPGSIEQLRRTS